MHRSPLFPLAAAALLAACADTPAGPGKDSAPPPVARVVIRPDSLVLGEGAETTLRAEAYDSAGDLSHGHRILWFTSAPSILAIDSTGAARAGVAGTATVSVLVDGVEARLTARVGVGYSKLVAGIPIRCGIRVDGRAYCWGANYRGVLDGTMPWSSIVAEPVRAGGGLRFLQITTGLAYICGITTGEETYCWGATNYLGELGRGDWTPAPGSENTPELRIPMPVAGSHRFTAIAAGNLHSCGLTADGAAYCWGTNGVGQLGTPTDEVCDVSTPCSTVPVRVDGVPPLVEIGAGRWHSCGLAADGRAFCWGDTTGGLVGRLHDERVAPPGEVEGDVRFESIDVALYHTCGLTPAQVAHCWGHGSRGQLGIDPPPDCPAGTAFCTITPQPVTGQNVFSAIDAVGYTRCALTANGEAYCWGEDLGASPRPVAAGWTFKHITGGYYPEHSYPDRGCGLGHDNMAYCWQANGVPVRVPEPRPET